jgi:hypothetical protein
MKRPFWFTNSLFILCCALLLCRPAALLPCCSAALLLCRRLARKPRALQLKFF